LVGEPFEVRSLHAMIHDEENKNNNFQKRILTTSINFIGGIMIKDKLKDIRYVNIKNKTSYSLMTAIGLVDTTIKRCQEVGHSAVCITENGNMMPALSLYDSCLKKGINSVIGGSLYFTESTNIKSKLIKANSITILAKNELGYRNSAKITSLGSLEEKFYSIPRIDTNDLETYKEGIIISSGGYNGIIEQAILHDRGYLKDFIVSLDPNVVKLKYSTTVINDLVKASSKEWNNNELMSIRTFLMRSLILMH
jgi:DNA polymerase III alpha subunit